MLEYKGYTGVVEFDADIGLLAGHVVDLRDEIYFEGDSVTAIQASFERAVDHYLEVCKTRGDKPEKPFSGKLNLRLGSAAHRAAAVAAATEGESINAWIVSLVQSAAAERRAISSGKAPRKAVPRKSARKKAVRKRTPASTAGKTAGRTGIRSVGKKSPAKKKTGRTKAS